METGEETAAGGGWGGAEKAENVRSYRRGGLGGALPVFLSRPFPDPRVY